MFQVDPILRLGAGVRHAFFSRQGGVSAGTYASLNCGFGAGDVEERVAINRTRAMDRLDLDSGSLVTLRQSHTAIAIVVEGGFAPGQAPVADGMATRTAGLVLGILAADCAPVLLVDVEARVIGAAHAGWRGAKAGIVEATVGAMARLGARPERIVAGIGPCIGLASYEVGPEFRAEFIAESGANDVFFAPSSPAGRFRFDLAGYVRSRLEGLGIAEAEDLGLDTCSDARRFFSHRRNVLKGERRYGRNLSAIALAP